MSEVKSLTVLLPGGVLPPALLRAVNDLAGKYRFRMYLSTAQNLRLMGIAPDDFDAIKAALTACGAEFKGPGKFPLPKICVGQESCNLGLVDTFRISRIILERFKDRKNVKPKFKIAVSGCPAACSGPLLADIGIVATRTGFDMYVGGKGGPVPKVGRRVVRGTDEAGLLDSIERLVDFHDVKTAKKQRFYKLLDDPEFPFREEV